jgi:hypothetical protein
MLDGIISESETEIQSTTTSPSYSRDTLLVFYFMFLLFPLGFLEPLLISPPLQALSDRAQI